MSTDLRALGRLTESLDGRPPRRRLPVRRGGGPARRRPRVPRPVIAVVVIAAVALAWLGLVALDMDEAATPADGAGAVEVPVRPAGDDPERISRSDVRGQPNGTFARIEDLRLSLPHPDPLLVAFAEAGRAEALALEPVGRLIGSGHDRFTAPDDTRGPGYVVLASEGRPRAPTSAADVVVPDGATVTAPVDGRITRVREYAMEGGVRDYRVVIEAADQPSLQVVLVHLQEPSVAAGDVVRAGETPIGTARLLPFSRAVDAHLDERSPHVHLEVRPAGEPEPADPNEPAAPPASARGR